MTTLPEFLLARIAEDEEVARRNWDGIAVIAWPLSDAEGFADVSIAAPRVLAECEARRKILDEHAAEDDRPVYTAPEKLVCGHCAVGDRWDGMFRDAYPCHTVKYLALPYEDHPDFDPAWRL